ncbi:hypothetical protein GOP47_0004507 [Adiantum capillus-veneris]|uniref:DnaJ homolog subfamily C member 2-like n=1 Tax=Adiantum capillus-veneris TaxID=13818 RepID=A0A9D4ZMW4_ADICA|nr:hypothetical protein GOP47_0004507 [Adiantum capillus-veneris]
MPARRPLLIAYPSPDARDGLSLPLFASSNCSPLKTSRYEPAGFSFHSLALRLSGLELLPDDKQESSDASLASDDRFSSSSDAFHFKSKKKAASGHEEQDHYALLGLSHLRYLATEDQIRKCYREAALKFHPDKQGALLLQEETEAGKAAKKEEIDQHFKAIQKAYEVLIDPVKRRIFDSTDEFDDVVPGDCAPHEFYKVFGPVFMRNARWSIMQQVPVLGDDDTPLHEVDKFYDFWNSFKSWREFPDANEYDLEEAESREHKRWMERQNAKLSEKARKEESARIRSIVENAYKRDPRILRRKEEEKAEKLRKKQAKFQARKEKEEEAARVLEEERLRKELEEKKAADEAAAQRKVKEKEKKLLRKEKSRLRTAAADVVDQKISGLCEEDVETLCSSLDIDELRRLCEGLEGKDAHKKGQILKQALNNTKSSGSSISNGSVTDDQVGVAKSSEENKLFSTLNANEKKDKPWSKEEVDLLRKGMQKYPKGTPQRWEVVSSYMGTDRSVEEILKATKTVLLQKPDSTKAFDSFLEKRKAGNVVIASPLSTRDELQGSPEQSSSKVVENGDTGAKKAGKSPTAIADETGKRDVSNGDLPTANGKSSKEEPDVWSDVQEGALVKAMKAFPKDTPQRWDRIATAVPGKTKAQCFRKFAELRENFRSKKSGD